MSSFSVYKCVCHEVSFADLKKIVDNEHDPINESPAAILKALKSKTQCSTNCGMCTPYILKMIQTGQTRFEPMPFPCD